MKYRKKEEENNERKGCCYRSSPQTGRITLSSTSYRQL